MMLELAGVPLRSLERDASHPLVIAAARRRSVPSPWPSSSTRSSAATAKRSSLASSSW